MVLWSSRCRAVAVWGAAWVVVVMSAAGCAHTAGEDAARSKAHAADAEPVLTAATRELNLRSLDVVWETVRDKHFDATLGGLDWAALREEYRPLVATATTAGEARAAMTAMLARLGQSHFGIIASAAYEGVSGSASGGSKSDGGGASKTRVRISRSIRCPQEPGAPLYSFRQSR